jgi:hypothetical protein
MPPTAGDRSGPYGIIAPLGARGMGELSCSRDPRLGVDVASKALPASPAIRAIIVVENRLEEFRK